MAEALFPYNPKDIKLCGFDDMHLQVGDRLEVQRIPPGLNRKAFMAELEARLEPAAQALLTGPR